MWGGGGGVMMLGNFQCWGLLTNLDNYRARAYCFCSGSGGGCLDIFSLACHFSFLSIP